MPIVSIMQPDYINIDKKLDYVNVMEVLILH